MSKHSDNGNHVALTKCYFCGDDNEIILHNRLGDVSMYHGKVCNMNPCNKCKEFMKQGIILIGIDSAKSGPNWSIPDRSNEDWMPNPYRTGQFTVIKEEAFKRIFTGENIISFAFKHRFMFIEGATLETLLGGASE